MKRSVAGGWERTDHGGRHYDTEKGGGLDQF